jgi:hypothetical protein
LVAYPDVAFGEFTDSHLLQFLLLFPRKSQRIRKAHLASWFRWGYKVRRIQANPVELLPDIKRHAAKIPDLFTDGEVAILEALPLPDGPLMSLLFGAGLRKAEARHLTARRIDFAHRRVIVSEGAKGARDRAVPMLDELASPSRTCCCSKASTRASISGTPAPAAPTASSAAEPPCPTPRSSAGGTAASATPACRTGTFMRRGTRSRTGGGNAASTSTTSSS